MLLLRLKIRTNASILRQSINARFFETRSLLELTGEERMKIGTPIPRRVRLSITLIESRKPIVTRELKEDPFQENVVHVSDTRALKLFRRTPQCCK